MGKHGIHDGQAFQWQDPGATQYISPGDFLRLSRGENIGHTTTHLEVPGTQLALPDQNSRSSPPQSTEIAVIQPQTPAVQPVNVFQVSTAIGGLATAVQLGLVGPPGVAVMGVGAVIAWVLPRTQESIDFENEIRRQQNEAFYRQILAENLAFDRSMSIQEYVENMLKPPLALPPPNMAYNPRTGNYEQGDPSPDPTPDPVNWAPQEFWDERREKHYKTLYWGPIAFLGFLLVGASNILWSLPKPGLRGFPKRKKKKKKNDKSTTN